ncbi:MAG: HNH endonuclease [Acidimicrobiaceae bacterium]|nr:HNH endonuclease [Acidimicrobiaceae bacterium]MYH43675.1 HNH endonuclease [Acidimicrobiaceae bacterium]MYL02680.1 HNH endonuclease [Acidimicrobiaceae bacterium]
MAAAPAAESPTNRKCTRITWTPFAFGGGTDLDNLIPLCWGCHARIHDHHWQVVDAGDGKHTIRPPQPHPPRPSAPTRHRSLVRLGRAWP